MIRVLEDEPLRAALKIKGFDRSKQFSWSRSRPKPLHCTGSCAAMTVKRQSLSVQREESKPARFCDSRFTMHG